MSDSEITVVTLKNGAKEAKVLVASTKTSIEALMDRSPMVFYDFVMKCRDGSYQFFGNSGEELLKLGLVEQDGSIHESIRNITICAVEGEGMDMRLGSPVATG